MTKKILTYIWIFALSLFLINSLTRIEITNILIKHTINIVCLIGLIYSLTPRKFKKSLIVTLEITVIIGFYITLKPYLDWKGEWKTQTIIYQNLHLKNRTIEFQLQDIGALGYNKRFIDRLKLLPFISWTHELKETELKNIDTLTWEKVDIDVNAAGLKGG